MIMARDRGKCVYRFRAKFSSGNIDIYLHFVSFLHIDSTQVVEILPLNKTRTYLFYVVNIMTADVLAT